MEVLTMGAPDAQNKQFEIVDIYEAAWARTPFPLTPEDLDSFGHRLVRHASNPDFKLLLAQAAGSTVGFAYGYTSVPGGWWRQTISTRLDGDQARLWFDDCFEFAELAVLPDYQTRGIGTELHDLLLEDLPHRTAMLSTQVENADARDFYLRRGWVDVIETLAFPHKPFLYAIMGLNLRNRRARTGSFHPSHTSTIDGRVSRPQEAPRW